MNAYFLEPLQTATFPLKLITLRLRITTPDWVLHLKNMRPFLYFLFGLKKRVRKSVFKKKKNSWEDLFYPPVSSLKKHDIIITCLVWTLLNIVNLISTKWLLKYNSRHCFAMIYMRRTIRLFRLIHPIRLNFTTKHLQENLEEEMFSFKVQIESKRSGSTGLRRIVKSY